MSTSAPPKGESSMKGSIAVIALVLVTAGCSDVTAPSPEGRLRPGQRSNDVVKETNPSTTTVINACNGDVVALTGEQKIFVETKTLKDGGTQSHVKITGKYEGVGTSGMQYKESDRVNDSFVIH